MRALKSAGVPAETAHLRTYARTDKWRFIYPTFFKYLFCFVCAICQDRLGTDRHTHTRKTSVAEMIEHVHLLCSGLGDYLFVHRRRGEGEGDKAADYAVPRILERYDE